MKKMKIIRKKRKEKKKEKKEEEKPPQSTKFSEDKLLPSKEIKMDLNFNSSNSNNIYFNGNDITLANIIPPKKSTLQLLMEISTDMESLSTHLEKVLPPPPPLKFNIDYPISNPSIDIKNLNINMDNQDYEIKQLIEKANELTNNSILNAKKKENGEIKGYYAPGEKYTAGERNSIGSRIRHNSINNCDRKSISGKSNIINPSKRPIPSIILTERTETNSSTSSLIPTPHFLKDFSKKLKIAEEDELNTDISDDNEDYDDLDIPLVKNKNYKSNPLSSTPVKDVIIGPKELEKIDIKDEIDTKIKKEQERKEEDDKREFENSILKQTEKPLEKQTLEKKSEKPLEKQSEKLEKQPEKQLKQNKEVDKCELAQLSPIEDLKRNSAIKRPLKTKESYDFIDDLLVEPIRSAPPFISTKPINIKVDKGRDYHSNPSSPRIIIQPSTPTQTLSINYTNAVGTISNNSSNSSLATTISSTIKPNYSDSDLNIPSIPSNPLTSNTSFSVLSLSKPNNNTKKLNKVGRRGAFYDHKNDPDLLSVSIPSLVATTFKIPSPFVSPVNKIETSL